MPIEIENEYNTIIEEMKKQFKKMSVVAISSFAQTIFQSLISMKVAQTKLSWDNLKKSSMYSAGIIILNTFVEPKSFQWISNIKSWIYSKINPEKQTEITKLQLGLSMLNFTITSIFQSYGEVVLDKLSNNNFEAFLDLDILKSTGTNALFTAAIAIIEEKIIDILKENIEKFKTKWNKISDLDANKSQEIESGSINNQEELEDSSISSDSNDETKLLNVEPERVSYKSLLLTLPLFLSSTVLVWLNESVDNDTDINFKTLLVALPFLALYNLGSLFFSTVNCIVNGEELPLISLFKKCTKSKDITSNEIAVVVDNSITDIEDVREVVIQVDQRQIIPINIKEINEACNNENNYSSWPNLSTNNLKSKEEIKNRSLTF